MSQNKTIAALQEELKGIGQDKALGHISVPEYRQKRAEILKQIEVIDTRTNCTFSADPTPEQSALHGAKMRCFDRIEPYKNRIGIPKFNGIMIALKSYTTIAEVQALYDRWRSILQHKQIADLPDFNATRTRAA